jgi:hypothetical protein
MHVAEVVTRQNAQHSDVVLVVCPTGSHGGGDVLAGVWYRDGGAKCECGEALVPIEEAPEAAKAAVAEVQARHDAQVAHPNADTSPAETATESGAVTATATSEAASAR